MFRQFLAHSFIVLTFWQLAAAQVPEAPSATPTGGVLIKENFLERLEAIKRSTPVTCSLHNGIECEKGADPKDGSVICRDEFRDSRESFNDFCTQTRLQLISETFLDKEGNEIPKELRKPKTFGGITPAKIVVKLRNLSGIKAKFVKVEGEIVKRKFRANGPMDMEPFSLEEYIVEFEESLLPIFPDFRTKYRTLVGCDNCLSSKRNL
jgi:hypothetical protein